MSDFHYGLLTYWFVIFPWQNYIPVLSFQLSCELIKENAFHVITSQVYTQEFYIKFCPIEKKKTKTLHDKTVTILLKQYYGTNDRNLLA